MSLAVRWITIGVLTGLAAVAITTWILRTQAADQAAQREQAWLRWETCVLNNQPRCGPMPQP